jgi:xanthine dehydrogenase, molybdenum binding subunit apoprotein (EC 1.17.1.4)
VQCLLGLAALRLPGRSIKMWWDREESFLAGYKRHAARMQYTLGATADGTLKALRLPGSGTTPAPTPIWAAR